MQPRGFLTNTPEAQAAHNAYIISIYSYIREIEPTIVHMNYEACQGLLADDRTQAIYNAYVLRERDMQLQQRLSEKKKNFGYSNILESLLYLLYFIPGTGLASIFLGFLFNNIKSLGVSVMAENTPLEERNKVFPTLKNIGLHSAGLIALLASVIVLSPIIPWVSIGLTALSGFYSIYKKYSAYKAARDATQNPNESDAIFNLRYEKDLAYAKSDLRITLRNESVKLLGIVFLASLLVTSLSILSGGFFPLICIGIGSAFMAYNAYARYKQEKTWKTSEDRIETIYKAADLQQLTAIKSEYDTRATQRQGQEDQVRQTQILHIAQTYGINSITLDNDIRVTEERLARPLTSDEINNLARENKDAQDKEKFIKDRTPTARQHLQTLRNEAAEEKDEKPYAYHSDKLLLLKKYHELIEEYKDSTLTGSLKQISDNLQKLNNTTSCPDAPWEEDSQTDPIFLIGYEKKLTDPETGQERTEQQYESYSTSYIESLCQNNDSFITGLLNVRNFTLSDGGTIISKDNKDPNKAYVVTVKSQNDLIDETIELIKKYEAQAKVVITDKISSSNSEPTEEKAKGPDNVTPLKNHSMFSKEEIRAQRAKTLGENVNKAKKAAGLSG